MSSSRHTHVFLSGSSGPGAQMRRRGRRRVRLAGLLSVVMAASVVAAIAGPISAAAPQGDLPRAHDKVIPHTDVPLGRPRAAVVKPSPRRADTQWPAGGAASVVLAAAPKSTTGADRGQVAPRTRRAGTLPVSLTTAKAAASTATVRVTDQSTAVKAGVAGVVLTVAPAAGVPPMA